jgi:hypothetical protein
MNGKKIKEIIRDYFDQEYIILETLVLKRYQGKLVVVSDKDTNKEKGNETFRNRERLKAAGFKWNASINAWTIDENQLKHAQETLAKINTSKFERFIDRIEEIPEFLENSDMVHTKRDELSEKINKYVDDLSQAVDKAAASAEIKKLLEFNSKFHNYSFANVILIWMQNRNATRVAGFKQWQQKFHRRVKPGREKNKIWILAPWEIKVKNGEKETSEPDVEEPDTTQTADSLKSEPSKVIKRFISVAVYDIADTEPMGPEGEVPVVKWSGSDEPNQKANELFEAALELAKKMGVNVTRGDANTGEMGWSSGGHINITSTIDGVNKAAVIIHEIAHELMHFKDKSMFYIGDEKESFSKEANELQAEAVSYVVIRHYDLPADHHANYLAMWSANKNSVKNNLEIIKKVASYIIKEIDKILKKNGN